MLMMLVGAFNFASGQVPDIEELERKIESAKRQRQGQETAGDPSPYEKSVPAGKPPGTNNTAGPNFPTTPHYSSPSYVTPPLATSGETSSGDAANDSYAYTVPAGKPPQVPSARERHRELADGFLDRDLNIVWARKDNGARVNYAGAVSFCKGKGRRWRLPSDIELRSLHEHGVKTSHSVYCGPSQVCEISPLINLSGTIFFTNYRQSYLLSMHGRRDDRYSGRALCVRPANSSDLLQ